LKYIEKIVSTEERMYCPSTGEVIFSPGMKTINSNASAFTGYWHEGRMNKPSIKNQELKEAWESYYKKNLKKRKAQWEDYQRFFKEYNNPEWITYECKFILVACVTFKIIDIYVVKADTVIEKDPGQQGKEVIKLKPD